MPKDELISQLELEAHMAYKKMMEAINIFYNAYKDYTTLLSDEEIASLGYTTSLLSDFQLTMTTKRKSLRRMPTKRTRMTRT